MIRRNTLFPAALPSLLFIVLILKEPDLGTAHGLRGGDGDDAVPGRHGGEIFV